MEEWNQEKPFYLFIHYIDAHNPLKAPRPFNDLQNPEKGKFALTVFNKYQASFRLTIDAD